jgi:hypothetical protein
MSFKEWLYTELINDGIIDEDTDLEDITEQMLLEDTEVDTADIENYREQFRDHCNGIGEEPVWDVEEA